MYNGIGLCFCSGLIQNVQWHWTLFLQWADPECTMALDFVFAVGWSRMYNGIGLSTARGSGTNGFVQRNLSSVKRTKDRVDYRTEEDVARLEKQLNRQPNAEILSHDRKRRVELKCMEMHELMEEQGWVSTLSLILCFFLNPSLPFPTVHSVTDSRQASFKQHSGRPRESWSSDQRKHVMT